jgi:hypothetical protein
MVRLKIDPKFDPKIDALPKLKIDATRAYHFSSVFMASGRTKKPESRARAASGDDDYDYAAFLASRRAFT